MKSKSTNPTRTTYKLVWLGIGLGALSWIIEAYIHVLVSPQENFVEQLLTPPLHDVCLRSVIAGLLILFSVYAQFIINQRKRAEEALQKAHDELEQRVEERTAELATTTEQLELELADRKRAEESLRAIFEAAENVSLITMDLAGTEAHILEFSPGAERIFGYSREEVIGKPVAMLHLPEDVARFPEVIDAMRQRKEGFTGESTLVRKSGERFPALFTTYPIFDAKGNMTATLGVSIDITKRKQAEDALRESESQKRALLDSSIDRIRYVDQDMRIIWANKTTGLEIDMSPEDLVGQVCYKLFHDRDTPCEGCPTVRTRETGQIERAIMHHPKTKGIEGETYWDSYSVPLKNNAGEIVSFIHITRDITEQKRAEEHIRALSRQLIKAQESERQRLSRDLHDNLAQELSSLKIGLDTLLDDYSETPAEMRQRVSQLSTMLQETIMGVRNLAYDFRPAGLDQLGLVTSVHQYCEEFSAKNGVNVDFFAGGIDETRVGFDTKITLYRLIQEALNNVKKHADASQVTIRLVASFPNIILRIEDNGKGFDVENRLASAADERRMGLRTMQERVALLQGKMRVESRPMQGTKIFIEVPCKEENNGE